MFALHRRRWIALLLIVMISYTAFSVHVSTHAPDDQTSCELCTGYGSQPHAVSDPASSLKEPARFIFVPQPALAAISTTLVVHYRQRAPPPVA